MSGPMVGSKAPTIRRILKEAAELSNSPSPDYTATPTEGDLFEWHFTLRGPPNSAFAEGIYHGRIVLPPAYPLRPPMFRFSTPSGRFEPNREICLSISGHHEESWQPAWGVRTALVAIRSFMETDAKGQLGGLDSSDTVRRRLASESRAWTCPGCARSNTDILAECEQRCKELGIEQEGEGGDNKGAASTSSDVPAELKIGFRDEMEKEKAKREAEKAATATEDAKEEEEESAQLAEGFVQTAEPEPEPQPRQQQAQSSTLHNRSSAAAYSSASTRAAPTSTYANGPTQMRQRPYDSNAGVPPWLDYAILALVIMLAAMLFKVLFGF